MEKIGKYRVLGKAGNGGTSNVYVVKDDRIGKKWAIKELPKAQKGERDGLFVLKRLDHPAIPRIVEELEDDCFIYEVMDYVEGMTLTEYAESGRIDTVSELLSICADICGIISYLHGQEPPVIFRDIKPDNFIVTNERNIKLVDFDIALLGEQTGMTPLGTRGYAAPEQYSGICSMRTDVYSLGVTILKLCRSVPKVRGRVRVWDRGTFAKLEKEAGKAAAKDPGVRHGNAGELLREIEAIRRVDRLKKPCFLAAAFLVLVCVLAGSVRGIYREAYRSDVRRRAAYCLENANAAADEIIGELTEDPDCDVGEDMAALYREIVKAGSLVSDTDSDLVREVIHSRVIYYEIAGSLASSEAEKTDYYRKAAAEIVSLAETADEEELCCLYMKGAQLSRAVGDTGGAERFYARFIESDVPEKGEKIAAWVSVISMRLYEERNIDTAREALREVLFIEGAEQDDMVTRYRELIEAEDLMAEE